MLSGMWHLQPLKMDGHKVKVTFTEEEQNCSRLRLAGVLEHQVESLAESRNMGTNLTNT